jgi:glycosyltransferase involved in cell wall biosynthesis
LIHFNSFPPLTGGDYVYFKLYQALKSKFDVKNISTLAFICRFNKKFRTLARHTIHPLAVLYPLCTKKSYDLIFTSWSCEVPFFGNLVYAQPPTGYIAKVVKGCRFSKIHHERLLGTLVDTFGTGVTWPWRWCFGQFSLKYHNFISNSYITKKFIECQFGKESLVVYPPVPTYLYDAKRASKENMVVSIGRVIPEKRFDLISAIGSQIPEARFILIGEADFTGRRIVKQIETKFKESGLKGNFIYLGRVSESVKRDLLLRAKVLFHPAPYESFGISIVEGMAAGAIPVAHNSGGPSEIVPSQWLFKDVDEAANKVRRALNEHNSNIMKEMVQLASKFSEERFKHEIIDIVDSIIQKS